MLSSLNSWVSSFWGVSRFKAHVTTGDRRGAGTDSTVWLRVVDASGHETQPNCLDKSFVNDHERGETHVYNLNSDGLQNPDQIDHIVIWRDSSLIVDDRWFLDRIELEDRTRKVRYIFPVQRWIEEEKRYYLYEFDAFLPQFDKQIDLRKMELARKRDLYTFKETIERGPKQIKELPEDEKFSTRYMLDFLKLKGKLVARQYHLKFTTEEWASLEDVKNIYHPDSTLHRPVCTEYWTEDRWFGLQRVQGVNAVLITLCKHIPQKLAVEAAEVEPFLEGLSLKDALEKNKIFIIDLELLNRTPCKSEVPILIAPIGLFYLNKKGDLMPVAIQLFQERSPTNPVYFPSDPPFTWLLAKMFFNMGDAQQHQSCTHLGLTHLLMETMCVSAHRHLSPSHPIFRLLAPHYLYLLAINARGLEKLISPGGWVDSAMTVGRCGMFKLISRGFRRWRLDAQGDVEKEIQSRGVLDPEILPHYPYREDAVPLFKIIKSYVTKVVKYYYDTPEKLSGDYEVQNWVKEMSTSQSSGGLGIGGMPEILESVDQLVAICTSVVSTCSMGHAGANFQQYDAYGFVPNYPGILMKLPPQTKREMTEKELLEYLPNKSITLDIMVVTKLLSMKGTKSLGDFEVKYLYDPDVVHIVDEFRLELQKLSNEIKSRNKKREFIYDWFDPDIVPNSIGI